MNISKSRMWIAVAILLISSVYFVYGEANLTPSQEFEKGKCGGYYQQCTDACGKWTGKADIDVCFAGCTEDYNQCLKDHGIPPGLVKKGPDFPVHQITPPPKSNPTKPRKGPAPTAPPN